MTLRNFDFNLETFLGNLESAVEESEVFENIGKLAVYRGSHMRLCNWLLVHTH